MSPHQYTTFDEAVAALATTVNDVFPDILGRRCAARNVSQMGTTGRGRGGRSTYGGGSTYGGRSTGDRNSYSGRGRCRGDSGRGGGGRKEMCNGVNITNLERFYRKDELDALPYAIPKMIMSSDSRQKKRAERGTHISNVSVITESIVQALTRGVQAASAVEANDQQSQAEGT